LNLFELLVKIGVDDQASKKLADISGKLGNGLKTAAKIGTAAVGAAAAGITALTTAAVKNYAEYEQLVGGVETLFNESADRVKQYANEAYKSAGLSVNEYMSTVTGFSASLLQSLGRGAQTDLNALKENLDEQYDATKKSWQDRIKLAKKMKQNNVAELEAQMDAELKALKKGNKKKLEEAEKANNKSVTTAETQALAADLANQAVIDMADNAAKMGTSMELIQNAYAGFSKQNYTMLDNLKLGYGGTQAEMQRLIKDAAALDKSIDANSTSFANIVKAINVVQTEMGITGTTAKEAGRTIEGSINAMKSAWTNLVTGIADGNADIEALVDNLVTTIVGDGTENNLGVLGNVIPAVKTAIGGASTLISELLPEIIEQIPSILEENLPVLISGVFSIIETLISSLDNEELVDTLVDTIVSIVLHAAENTPKLVGGLISLILSVVSALGENLDQIIPAIIVSIIDLISEIASKAPEFTDAIFSIIDGLVGILTSPEGLAKMTVAGVNLLLSIISGIIGSIPRLIAGIFKVIGNIILTFKDTDWGQLGRNLVDGFKNGISNAWANLKKWFKSLFSDLIGIAKKILGIASPSKVFKKIGGFTAEGFGAGFEDEFAHVKDDMEDALNFDDASVGINASIRKVGAGAAGGAFGGTSIGNITINIDGAKYSDEQSLASAIALEIQNMTDRRAAVYA
jgi:phage-related protein